MKKFTWLLSLASLMVPMTLSAQQVKKDVTSDVTLLKGSSSLLKKNVPAPADKQVQKLSGLTKGSSLRRGPKAEPSADAVVWDFESEDQFNEWTLVDNDGDGFNWEYYNNEGKETGRMTAHEGYGLVASASYDNDTGNALTPDNWMISPEVSLGGVLSFWACGQDASYAAEVFGVYVCEGSSTNPADFVQVGKDKTATDEMTMYDFDLSEYAGKTGRIAIRHYHVTDMFFLDIDDVCIDNSSTYDPDPEDPTDITVAPTATSAVVTWEGADGDNWNLRYKVYNPNEKVELLWDLPYDGYEDQVEGWSIYDKDGDGYNWGLAYSSDAQDDLLFYSESYSSGALTPDNWLITPDVRLGGVFTFEAKNAMKDYPDVLGVYVHTAEAEFDQIVQIGEDITPGTAWETFTFDTSNYDGQLGNIIIRHYNSEDQYKIYVDNVSYTKDGDEPAEWIDVNGLTDTNYTIEGLDPETDYMVQVQAYNDKAETDWSDYVFFSTDAEDNAATGIEAVANSSADASVYTVTGVQVSKLSRLPKGVYIVGGKKVVVK